MNRTVQDLVRALRGPLVFVALIAAWWLDWRGFWHGVAATAQVWWLWSIRPRGANASGEGRR
jgi:small-conductance mechanosensitive channel